MIFTKDSLTKRTLLILKLWKWYSI